MNKIHQIPPAEKARIPSLSTLERLTIFIAVLILNFPVMAEDTSFTYSPIPAVDCVINPNQVVDLASPVPGVIDKLLVERSQQVTAGQVIAQLDAGVERANVDLARYRSGVQSEISVGMTNLKYDRQRLTRLDVLYHKQVISAEITEEAEREVNLSKLSLEQARELSVVRKLELQRAREQLRQKSITAPFDGFVLDTYKYKGEYVEDQAIVRLAQFDPLVIEAIVPMENFREITPGMMAEILPEFDSNETLTGVITIVDRMGDTASNTFGVRMVLPNPENRIPAGLKCVAKFLDPLVHRAPAVSAQQDKYQARPDQTEFDQIRPDAEVEQSDALPTGIVVASTTLEHVLDEVPATGLDNNRKRPDVKAEATESSGYVVASPQGETRDVTQDLISKLREAGIHDLQEADHGRYDGMVLLGYYKSWRNALQRQTALAGLGFIVDIHEHY